MNDYTYDRARKIVRLASTYVKDPSTKSWLLADERGSFEKDAKDLLVKSAARAAELGMSADQVDAEIANLLGYRALTAMLEHQTKNTKKKGRRR
jgi:hypothetical protein